MSSHFVPPLGRKPVGGAAVGWLAELDPVAMLAVHYLRLWCDHGTGPLASDFSLALGQPQGTDAAETFAALCMDWMTGARRPIMRHQTGCRCLGGDEACFARLVAEASSGAREDALMIAFVMVRADHAPGLVALAQQSGLVLQRMLLRGGPGERRLH